MSREIKFRAWNNTGCEYVYFDPEKMRRDVFFAVHFFTLMAGKHAEGYLEQYTGLKDSAGVEIYEGDIVAESFSVGENAGNIMDGCVGEVKIGLVPDMEINCNEYSVDYCGVWADMKSGNNIEDRCDFSQWEVIGNIHENPELLQGEKL
jgi:uncharacterized phage protein (TIGR01671 family)